MILTEYFWKFRRKVALLECCKHALSIAATNKLYMLLPSYTALIASQSVFRNVLLYQSCGYSSGWSRLYSSSVKFKCGPKVTMSCMVNIDLLCLLTLHTVIAGKSESKDQIWIYLSAKSNHWQKSLPSNTHVY